MGGLLGGGAKGYVGTPLSNYWGGGGEGWPPSSYAYAYVKCQKTLIHCSLRLKMLVSSPYRYENLWEKKVKSVQSHLAKVSRRYMM